MTELKVENWKRYGKVYVRRDQHGHIKGWITAKDYEEANIKKLNNSPVIVYPLKHFPRKKEKQEKQVLRRKNPKKTKITIKLSTDLVNLLNFLKGRKSLGNLIEELLKEALKEYRTL
ncbi:hypothetical protein J7K27_04150 [Candidatus Bathyarchaeota archaeon]|nr:hypothetical protein [Candidatus Bathyarchaeota archaeon]